MTKTLITLGALALAASATPALAHPEGDENSHWRDYQTDISEARRELRSDLRRANDAGDREDAWSEYRREVADARHDYNKEMIEKGYSVRRGVVTVGD